VEITRREVEGLGALRSDQWPIVSLYLRVDKEHVTDDHYSIRLKNLLPQLTLHRYHVRTQEQQRSGPSAPRPPSIPQR
jgi:peptide chain release factor subunit 1